MRTFVEISRQRLVENYRALREVVGENVEMVAVVKADAYGHGAAEVASTLQQAGARWFGVTSVEEGIELRRHGLRGRILLLCGFEPGEQEALADFDLTPMIQGVGQLRDLAEWAGPRRRTARCHVEFDSGMGRLGVEEAQVDEVVDVFAGCPQVQLEGLATHFASAEDFTSRQTEEQIGRFRRVVERFARRGLRPRYTHAANSAALGYRPETYGPAGGSMVRPGLALYGYLMPARGAEIAAAFRVSPVLAWKARILTIKPFPAGVPLGYNAAYRTERPMRVGVIAAGYADGLDRKWSNGGSALAAGRRVAILGWISMDVSLVDLTETPEAQPGDYVTLLGEEGPERVDALEIADRCGTIPYEILCRIGRRAPRVYRET
jgi:alanine racemase